MQEDRQVVPYAKMTGTKSHTIEPQLQEGIVPFMVASIATGEFHPRSTFTLSMIRHFMKHLKRRTKSRR